MLWSKSKDNMNKKIAKLITSPMFHSLQWVWFVPSILVPKGSLPKILEA
jgi:hypothetical protein